MLKPFSRNQWTAAAILVLLSPCVLAQSAVPSLTYLRHVMDSFHDRFPVYDDISSPGNHFHARGQLPDEFSRVTINGSWTGNPHSGATAIRCTFAPRWSNDFGGFYFLNGILYNGMPVPYFGGYEVPGTPLMRTEESGIDLSGATFLTFWARGENGDEQIEFFLGGVGRNPHNGDPEQPFPDSTRRTPAVGNLFTLATDWQLFSIDLSGVKDLSNIMGGFGWVASAQHNPDGAVFYLDDIQYVQE